MIEGTISISLRPFGRGDIEILLRWESQRFDSEILGSTASRSPLRISLSSRYNSLFEDRFHLDPRKTSSQRDFSGSRCYQTLYRELYFD
jgi:hypothetical protein